MAVISLPGWLQPGRGNRGKADDYDLAQKKKRRQSSMGTRVRPKTAEELEQTKDWGDFLSLIVKVVTVGVFLLLILASINWVIKRPMFVIQRIQVTGNLQQIDKELIGKRLQSMPGNFFTLNLGAAAKELKTLPWVSHVQLRRLWPNGVEAAVTEHHPMVRWGDQQLIDTDGQLFEADYLGELPHYQGPVGTQNEVLREAQEFNRQLATIQQHVDGLTLTERRAWTLQLSNGLVINLGRANIHERLGRFIQAYPVIFNNDTPQGKVVDLRYDNGFALRVASVDKGVQ